MKQYDLMILGPATRDVNIDYTGEESRIVGGAVTFCTPAAAASCSALPNSACVCIFGLTSTMPSI